MGDSSMATVEFWAGGWGSGFVILGRIVGGFSSFTIGEFFELFASGGPTGRVS